MNKNKSFKIRMTENDYKILREYAEAKKLSMSEVLRDYIRFDLKEQLEIVRM